MTLAANWVPSSGAASSTTGITSCSGKLGFATAEELRWWMNRRSWPKAATHVYRCPSCDEFHATSQPQAASKRRVRRDRKRGMAERSDVAETAAVQGMTEQPEAAS